MDRLERIIEALSEAMLDDARWPEASKHIDMAYGARGGILTFGDEPTPGNVRIFLARSFHRGVDRSDLVRDYLRNYYAEDEHMPRWRALPDGKVVPFADLFSARERKTSRTYNEAFARFGCQKGLHIRLDGPGGSRIGWGIADPIAGHGWSSSQIDMIRQILPHLRQYVRVRTALADSGALGRSVAELLDSTRLGVIQLDSEGRIVEANDRAAELLRRNDGLSDRGGMLRTATPEDNSRLQELLARALPRLIGYGASGSMVVRRPSQLPRLAMHIKPVAHRELDYRSRHVAALALIVDPASRAEIEPGRIQAILGLTPTESEIVSQLAAGRTLRQIAATTDRKYSTVRTHLKHVFVKLGVSRQFEVTQLVRALSDFPVSRD